MTRARMFVYTIMAALLLASASFAEAQIQPGTRLRTTSTSAVKIGREVVGTIPEGTEVIALRVEGDWVYVETGGVAGWIHTRRLQCVEPNSPDGADAPPAPTQVKLLDLLSSYMDRLGYRYLAVTEPFQQEGVIHTGFTFVNEGFSIQVVIDPVVEKNVLIMRAPRLFHAPRDAGTADRLLELLKAIGFINYSIILGRFSYDPRDGEVSFEVNMAIDDSVVSFEQFKHCLGVLCAEIQDKLPKLKAVWEGQLNADAFYPRLPFLPTVRPAEPAPGRTASLPVDCLRKEQAA